MVIREDNVSVGNSVGSIYHNWKTIAEAKASGRFDYILENGEWFDLEFNSEQDYLTHWNNITTWEDLLGLSHYFTEVK